MFQKRSQPLSVAADGSVKLSVHPEDIFTITTLKTGTIWVARRTPSTGKKEGRKETDLSLGERMMIWRFIHTICLFLCLCVCVATMACCRWKGRGAEAVAPV